MNEATVTALLSFTKAPYPEQAIEDIAALNVTVSGAPCHRDFQTIGTSEERIAFGEVTTPGLCLIINRDPTNYVQLRQATGAAAFAKLKPGEPALFRWDAGCTAPFAVANTGACTIEILLLPD